MVTRNTLEYQSRFLYFVKEIVPEVLIELKENIFPLFLNLSQDDESTLRHFEMRDSETLELCIRTSSHDCKVLLGAIQGWALRFNLATEWVYKFAVCTVRRQAGRSYKKLRFDTPTISFFVPVFHFTFEANGFTCEEVKKAMDSAYKRKQKIFLEKEIAPLDPKKLSDDQFRYLVLYQVKKMTAREIVEAEKQQGNSVEEFAVIKAYRRAAKLIELPLRKKRKRELDKKQ